MRELLYGVPILSSRRPHGEQLSRYHADTFFLDESSRPHSRARVYTKRPESKSTPQLYGLTAVD